MLVTLKEILKIAEEKKIAIGSFNTPNMASVKAVIGAAEELGHMEMIVVIFISYFLNIIIQNTAIHDWHLIA